MSNPIEKFINTYEGYVPSSTLFRSFLDDAINYARASNQDLKMDLRDYFAGKAMQGIVTNPSRSDTFDITLASKQSYQIADAMMKAREQ